MINSIRCVHTMSPTLCKHALTKGTVRKSTSIALARQCRTAQVTRPPLAGGFISASLSRLSFCMYVLQAVYGAPTMIAPTRTTGVSGRPLFLVAAVRICTGTPNPSPYLPQKYWVLSSGMPLFAKSHGSAEFVIRSNISVCTHRGSLLTR